VTGQEPAGRAFAGTYTLERRTEYDDFATFWDARARGGALRLVELAPGVADDQELTSLFLHEADAFATVDHPAILRVLDSASEGGCTFVVLELAEGRPLAQLLPALPGEGEPLAAALVLRIALDLCEALCALHSLPGVGDANVLIHGDLTPRSVLLREDGSVALAPTCLGTIACRAPRGARSGRLAYKAPEQLVPGATADGRADVAAVGAVLYEALSGVPPYSARTASVLERVIRTAPPVPLDRLRLGLPDAIASIVARALERDPEQRFASIDLLRSELERQTEISPVSRERAGELIRERTALLAAGTVERERDPWLLAARARHMEPPTVHKADAPAPAELRRAPQPVTAATNSSPAVDRGVAVSRARLQNLSFKPRQVASRTAPSSGVGSIRSPLGSSGAEPDRPPLAVESTPEPTPALRSDAATPRFEPVAAAASRSEGPGSGDFERPSAAGGPPAPGIGPAAQPETVNARTPTAVRAADRPASHSIAIARTVELPVRNESAAGEAVQKSDSERPTLPVPGKFLIDPLPRAEGAVVCSEPYTPSDAPPLVVRSAPGEPRPGLLTSPIRFGRATQRGIGPDSLELVAESHASNREEAVPPWSATTTQQASPAEVSALSQNAVADPLGSRRPRVALLFLVGAVLLASSALVAVAFTRKRPPQDPALAAADPPGYAATTAPFVTAASVEGLSAATPAAASSTSAPLVPTADVRRASDAPRAASTRPKTRSSDIRPSSMRRAPSARKSDPRAAKGRSSADYEHLDDLKTPPWRLGGPKR
jgi:eukaryotic-like serine/threonine-protein kinase